LLLIELQKQERSSLKRLGSNRLGQKAVGDVCSSLVFTSMGDPKSLEDKKHFDLEHAITTFLD